MKKIKLNRRDFSIIQLAFLATIASVFGWLVFQGISDILSLENLKPGVAILLGFGGIWVFYKFGISRRIK